MLDTYNLYPLHIFRLVARGGSVTRAAQELFISQPAVSAHLKALETAIGEPLFERMPRGMHLTPAGTILLEQVNRLFALYEEIPATVGALRGRVHGEVIGEMSIAESLQSVEIGSDHLQLVAAVGDTLCRVKQVKPEHLRGRTLLLREQGSSTRAGAERLLSERLKEFERVVEVPSSEAIKQAVASGLGIAVLSSWATRLEEAAGLLQPVRDPLLRHSRRFFLVKRKDRELIGNAAALWDCLTTCKPKTVSRKRKAGAVKPK